MTAVFCLIGAPGSGKGTHSTKLVANLSDSYSICRVSVGDELRAMRKTTASGDLSGIADVLYVIEQCLARDYKNNIFDGYPRSLEQMEAIGTKFQQNEIAKLHVINLDMQSADVLMERLANRAVCPKCSQIGTVGVRCSKCNIEMVRRADDESIDVIQNRLMIYQDSYKLIHDCCVKQNIPFANLDASGHLDEIYAELHHYMTHHLIH